MGMKIAYCLHGCVGGTTGKSGEKLSGKEVVLRESVKKLFKNLKTDNIDFFIHSWDTDLHNDFINSFNPKKIITEEQIVFDIPKHLPDNLRTQSHYSRWRSAQKCIELKSQVEKESNEKYDLVILTRFDLIWLQPFDLATLDSSKIHFDWSFIGGNKIYGGVNQQEWPDRIIISNSENMNYIGTMYDKLTEYTSLGQCPQYAGISSHFCLPWHMSKENKKSDCVFSLHFSFENYNNPKNEKVLITLYRYNSEKI